MNGISRSLIASVAAGKQIHGIRLFSVLPICSKSFAAMKVCQSSCKVIGCHSFQCVSRKYSSAGNRGWIHIEKRKEYALNAEEFKKAIDNDEVYVVDVREPFEVAEGRVPAKRYVNVPIGIMFPSLRMPDEKFREYFGAPKPGKDEDIVFMCKGGIRSTFALQVGQEFGYENSRHYLGGWAEWEETYPTEKI